MARVVVVGLGPAGGDLVTAGTAALLETVTPAVLRTRHHPAAELLASAETCDDLYDAASTLDEVYPAIVERLVERASTFGGVLYAVPGSPIVAERSVELLVADARVDVEVHPSLSFIDLVHARLRIDPLAAGVRLVDGQRFAVDAAGERGPLLVAQCDRTSVLSAIKLAVDEPPSQPVTVLQRLGLPDESVFEVDWADLDRSVVADHLTSLYIPHLAAPVALELARFVELVATLRRDCPWDREQTHQSLTRHLLEEAYELVEAIDGLDDGDESTYTHLEEELGDVLFQVVFHATIATEHGRFGLDDVARTVHDKLRARHPHVFGDVEVDGSDEVVANWEEIKRAEKGRSSAMDGLPTTLPALLLAVKAQRRAAQAGLRFPDVASAYAKVAEELAEVRTDPSTLEVGDLLFAASGLAIELGVDAEDALRGAARRFEERFRRVEHLAATDGRDLASLDDAAVDELWERAKTDLAPPDA